MDKDSKQVVVLLTHPNIKESRANKALMDAISGYNKKQHDFIPKERTIYYETESWRTAFLGYDRVGK